MLKKVVFALLILAVGVLSYQLLNSKNTSRPGARPATTTPQTATAAPRGEAPAENREQRPNSGNRQQPNSEAGTASGTQTQANGQTNQQNPATPSATPDANQPATESATPAPQQRRGGGIGFNGGSLAQQAATSVEIMRAAPSKQLATLAVFGVIEAQKSATLSATSVATVINIARNEGDSVNAGDRLVSLSSTAALEQLEQRKASLNELDARVRNENRKHDNDLTALAVERELLRIAKNSVDRFTSLNAQQLGSNTDYEAALRSYQSQLLSVQNRELTLAQFKDSSAQWQAQRSQLESQIRQSQQLVSELTLTSPFAGLVAKLAVKQGQEVRAGDIIADIFDPNSLALFVRVPVRYRLDQVQLSELTAIDQQGNKWQATAMRPINESGAQRITLQPADRTTMNALPGSHLALSLAYPLPELAIDVPITAVYDQQRVYVFDRESNAIKAIDVTILGRSELGYLISASSLTGQAPIVTTRLKNPVTGMKVSVARGNRGERS